MWKIIMLFSLSLAISMPSYAQVDTLFLYQINQFTIPENITECHAVDIWNDGSSELIIGGTSHVYVCNPINGRILWTSPGLARHPYLSWQIGFHDLNNDGILDMTIRDTYEIYAFDIANSHALFSAYLGENPRPYAFGDRNSDGILDFVTAERIHSDGDDVDTVWINIFDGPSYDWTAEFYSVVTDYVNSENHISIREEPSEIIIKDISGDQGVQRKIIIFTSIRKTEYLNGNPGDFIIKGHGNLKIIDPLDSNIAEVDSVGVKLAYSILGYDSISVQLYLVSQTYEETYIHWILSFYSEEDYLKRISSNGIEDSHDIPGYFIRAYIRPIIIDDINIANPGNEILFPAHDSLKLLSFPGLIPIWQIAWDRPSYFNKLRLYHSSLLDGPQLLLYSPPEVYNGSDGSPSAYFPETQLDTTIVNDLDNDGDDELITLNQNEIHIYRAVSNPVNVKDDSISLPRQYYISQNYPNPFNAQTTIEYSLPKSSEVSIDIYDILGRKIESLISERQRAGEHSIIWDAKDASSGIYFYRIKAGEFGETKKMLLIK